MWWCGGDAVVVVVWWWCGGGGVVVVWFMLPIIEPLQVVQLCSTLDCGNIYIVNAKRLRIQQQFRES